MKDVKVGDKVRLTEAGRLFTKGTVKLSMDDVGEVVGIGALIRVKFAETSVASDGLWRFLRREIEVIDADRQ
jgi:hypothetical protein